MALAAGCTGSAIQGTAFRDYNANGVRDPREPGIGGIVVTATGAGGGSVSCTTAADGSYGIDPPADLGAFPVRVEFTPARRRQPRLPGSRPRRRGLTTTVTFVAAPSSGVDVGFQNPAEYCGPDAGVSAVPDLVAACPAYGENNDNPDGLFKDAPVLYRFPYNAGSTDLGDEGAVAAPAPTVVAVASADRHHRRPRLEPAARRPSTPPPSSNATPASAPTARAPSTR